MRVPGDRKITMDHSRRSGDRDGWTRWRLHVAVLQPVRDETQATGGFRW